MDYCRVYQRKDLKPIVHNAGFESDELAPWSKFNQVQLANGHSHGGKKSVQIGPGGSCEQKIYGLTPQTTYTLTAWARGSKTSGRIGVKFPANLNITMDVGGDGKLSLTFTTGPADHSAIIFCQNARKTGDVYFDDVSVGR